jgi:hypothetical protein
VKKLVYYNPREVLSESNREFPGMDAFSCFFKIYNMRMALCDRTNTIVFPVQMQILFPLPAFKKTSDTLEEICDRRARELLARAENLGASIYVFWSGGIDSTLALVSLLKSSSKKQKRKIIILLSGESITENPNFYRDHIRGKLEVRPSAAFPVVLGTKDIITSGELGDQIFGSPFSAQPFMRMFGNKTIHEPYKRELLFAFYNAKLENTEMTDLYLNLFEKLMRSAPTQITTHFDYFWWLLFILEWQARFLSILQFTPERNASNITREYLDTNIVPFFGTDAFQLWSMNNLDKRIKDTWSSYKWPSKDIIFDYTKDADYYKNKSKEASRSIWEQRTNPYNFIDDSMKLYRTMDTEEYCNSRNSFIA